MFVCARFMALEIRSSRFAMVRNGACGFATSRSCDEFLGDNFSLDNSSTYCREAWKGQGSIPLPPARIKMGHHGDFYIADVVCCVLKVKILKY